MNGKNYNVWLVAMFLILMLAGGVPWFTMHAEPPAKGVELTDATRNKILNYIRERFGVPDTVKLALSPLHPSTVAPSFNEASVSIDDGKSQRAQLLLISKDARFLTIVMGGIIDLHEKSPAEMAQRIRETFKTPDNVKISVGGFKNSPSPDFEQGTVAMETGANKQDRVVLLSRDGKHLIVSELYNLVVDPREQVLRIISLHDVPTQGPADAPVTIVEYSDLECPMCAHLHEFFETKLVPRYGNKVRIVFKEFPLAMHEWSSNAAIACQCAYEINPSAFVPLRSAIFRSQQMINITNLRDSLLNFGEQAGLDRVKLAGCLDAKSSYPRIQRDMAEAKRLEVNQTPTAFINGRMMIGLPSEEAYFQAVDAALRGGK